MAAGGPRIEAYCYSEGPAGTSSPTGPDANASMATIEQATPGTTTYGRPTSPELLTTQIESIETEWDTSAPAGFYDISYDASTKRVTVESTNGTSFRPQMPGNSDQWFGFTQDLSSGWATSYEADDPPAGLVELVGVTVEPAEDAARVDLSEYRHGRSVAVVWGNHQLHRVQLWFGRSELGQMAAGYVTTGRVRIWQCGDTTAYSATNIDGYIDGWVVACDNPTEDGDVGELWTLDMVVAVAR